VALKTCKKCKVEKDILDFHVEKLSHDGHCSICKKCNCELAKVWRDLNPERNSIAKKWCKESKPLKYKETIKKWLQRNKQKVAERQKLYKEKNRERIIMVRRLWLENNKDKVRPVSRRANIKYRNNPRGRLRCLIGTAIWRSLKDGKAGRSWESLVGYNIENLKQHIENQFIEEMTWERFMHGDIHIDHIIPVVFFNFKTPQDIDFQRCFALKNLRPLWAEDNLKKGAKIEIPFQPALVSRKQEMRMGK
jgi:hypothetical protein